jgi:hypothetical protein
MNRKAEEKHPQVDAAGQTVNRGDHSARSGRGAWLARRPKGRGQKARAGRFH